MSKNMIKAAIAALFLSSFFSIPANSFAQELNAVNKAGVLELTSGLDLKSPLPAIDEALSQRDGLDPVVITVPGLKFGEVGWGPLELKHFLKLIGIFFPHKAIDAADIANTFVAFNRDYFFLEEGESAADLAAGMPERAMPDNYLELKLKEIPGYENHDIKVTPFPWSRDPADTEKTVPELEKTIIAAYDAYKNTGRPVYILAHSWGSVLAHEALHHVAKYRPDVRIDKFITAGSPLVPANFVVKLFMKLQIKKEHLEKAVTKPAGVKVWRNIWATRDAYSNAIPAADSNFQADAQVENVEPTLINLILHNKLLKKEARADLFKIRNIKDWHGAYFYDFKASLKSINKEIFVPVFRPLLAPQVVDCKKLAAPVCPI